MKVPLISLFVLACANAMLGQTPSANDYRVALPEHKGQLRWTAPGFQIVQTSAKPKEQEIGLRGRDAARRVTFLGYLFLVLETAPSTSAKCRDAALAEEKKTTGLTILKTDEIARQGGSVAVATYTAKNRDGSVGYAARGFVSTEDICGDLSFYSIRQSARKTRT
jgi:hypothetical protein